MYSAPFLLDKRTRLIRIVHFQGPWAQESKVAGQAQAVTLLKKSWEYINYHHADRIIVLTDAFKRLVTEAYKVPMAKVTVIAPGVDLKRFSLTRRETDQGRFRIICVRRLERRMGIEVLLEAWADVIAARPEARLDIYGSGSESVALQRLAVRLGVDDSVAFHGQVSDDELVVAYGAAAGSVVPSTALEGFGLVALESLACGTPAIVSDCGGLPDAVRGLDRSLVVPPSDKTALAGRILATLNGQVVGIEACRRHAERFSWSKVASDHLSMYQEARQMLATR